MHNRRDMGSSTWNASDTDGSTKGTTGSLPYYIPLVMHELQAVNAADRIVRSLPNAGGMAMYGLGGEAHGRCQPSGALGQRLHDEG